MADDKYRRRRRRLGDFGSQSQSSGRQREEMSPNANLRKPPITILGLAKPNTRVSSPSTQPESDGACGGGDTGKQTENAQHELSEPTAGTQDKPSVVLLSDSSRSRPPTVIAKNNETDHPDAAHQTSPGKTYASEEGAAKRGPPGSIISSVIDQSAQIQSKLAPPPERQGKIKLVDDHHQWCDNGLDLMLEQSDFVVVGAVGLQGCGKSTLLSLLAGNTHHDAYRNYLFFPQTKETKEDCLFQTSGIDMFVTSDRIILLDTEPLLSSSMMDCLLRYERKYPPEYTSLQNFIEMQSLQLLTFLLSVCNIILIADDWFVDINLLRLVLDAEMLKPSAQPSSSSSTDGTPKDVEMDLYPTVIFVHNKASREDFAPSSFFAMQKVLHEVFSSSKLKLRGKINMTNDCGRDAIIHHHPSSENNPAADVNLLLLPTMEFYKSEPEPLETSLPEYRGYPSFNTILSFYRSQILSAPRSPISHNVLSEKNWYHFAARMWDAVKKSPLMMEYNRLLSNSS